VIPVTSYPAEADWLLARASGIGGSDAPAILGAVGAFRTPWRVWLDKRGDAAERATSAKDKARGRALEAGVAELYTEATGIAVTRPGLAIARHPLHPWALASVDGFAADGGLIEVKTSREAGIWGPSQEIPAWDEATSPAVVRPAYAVQVYWYLEVTGAPWCDLVVLTPFYELRIYRFHRDPITQAAILDAVADWRERHIVNGTPPEIDGTDDCTEGLRRAFKADPAKPVEAADPTTAGLIAEFVQVQIARKADEAREAELKNAILAAMGTRYGLTSPAGKVIAIRSEGRKTIDAAGIAEHHPDIYTRFVRTSAPSIKLLATPAKESK
jgi:putative phage-type endonuclease